jgi:signal transduction histidine kinase/purine-cytosine permease-like protein
MPIQSNKIVDDRRNYNTWVATETLEDYALRFAPKSFRKWSEWLVANTAIGGLSFLALEAIGGAIALSYGFSNSFWAIVVVGIIIFLTGLPITYYAAKYNVDMDLLTRGAGFGYIGSTITSLIYASFTFIFFALESAIMAQALELYFALPLPIGYIVCSLVIIPLVFFGVTLINQLQLWTQPVWLLLMVIPYFCILYKEPSAFSNWIQFTGESASGSAFNPLLFGEAATISFSLIAQIGEQVDYLRFLPDKQSNNRSKWWLAVILAGPGWIVLGCAKQLGGAFLTSLAVHHGVSFAKANEPTQMYLVGFEYVFSNPEIVLAVTTLFVIISQVKINVTNAYAGSLAWSNFFSRLTHSHPGRVVWLVFNVAIALLLMELGVFSTLEAVLGLYANVAIAWIGALVADLVINKPLGLSPSYIEFKRAHLYNINPVGCGAMSIASLVAILAFVGVFGAVAKAFASFIALGLAFVLAPILALLTKGKYYIAREDTYSATLYDETQCCICEQDYEPPDMLFCPIYDGSICSLCCSLDACCHDACKIVPTYDDPQQPFLSPSPPALTKGGFQGKLSPRLGGRLLKYLAVFLSLSGLAGATLGFVYHQQVVTVPGLPSSTAKQLTATLLGAYGIFLVLIGIGSWWLVLTQESRKLAQEELDQRNLQLQQEVKERQLAELQLQEKAQQLEQTLLNLQQAEAQLIQTEKMAALGGLVAGIAHEINTPIGIGVTAASFLVEKTDGFSRRFHSGAMKRSDLEKFVDLAQQSAQMTLTNLQRAAALIQSFKQVAVDQSSESKRVFNLNDYVEEILLQLSPKLKATQHKIKVNYVLNSEQYSSERRNLEDRNLEDRNLEDRKADRALTLSSYPGAFSQIVTNLVINSLLHAYEPNDCGLITLNFRQVEKQLIFEYADTGKGILPEHLSKIFEPFFTTKRGQGGSGLGLHIVYNLVTQKLGGTIHCESQPGQGTKFIIKLPDMQV